jgi:hypothetical protein
MPEFLPQLTPLQWALLGAVPPAIIALYFLKLKRQPLAVPSTYLWSRAIEDLHVNSLWQRLRQSLLLLLQLLLVTLIALALLRPGKKGTELSGERFIFLVDTSASMSATDVSPTRLDEAKRRAKEMIDQMKSGQVAMIVSFSNVAKVEQPFTDNRRLLHTKIDLISQTNRPSDLSEALRTASGLANPGQSSFEETDIPVAEALPATMYILSDGGVPGIADFKLGNLTPEHLLIAEKDAPNVGIVALSTERNPEKPSRLQAFGRMENYGETELTVSASLSLNGTLQDAQSVTVPPRDKEHGLPGSAGVTFEIDEIETGVLKLEIDSSDRLAADNAAYSVVNAPHRAKVLVVTPGNDEALDLALRTEEAVKLAEVEFVAPDVLEKKEHLERAADGAWDLVIYDQCVPKVMPQANTLFLGRVPPVEDWSAGEKQGPPVIIDVDQAHPLTQLISMNNVRIAEGRPIKGPTGSTTLMEADIGPIFVIGPRGGFEDAVLGFDLYAQNADDRTVVNSDWPIRRSFPVWVLNCVKYLGGVRTSIAAPNTKPGSPIALRSTLPVETILVKSPRGETYPTPRESQNTFIFSRTDELGVYEVHEGTGQQMTQQFAVNLFDGAETNLNPRTIEIAHEEVKTQEGRQPIRKEWWKWIVLGALGILLFEWYVYNRRVYL